jgi:hypothetical protein
MKKAQKIVENQINNMFRILGNGVQFNIMDLAKIDKEAKAILLAGGAMANAAVAMQAAIAVYRVN